MADSEDPNVPTPLDVFLAQPSEVAQEDQPETIEPAVDTRDENLSAGRRFWRWWNRFLFEKRPSEYSSIAPRRADGTRTKLFWFNGNGRGR